MEEKPTLPKNGAAALPAQATQDPQTPKKRHLFKVLGLVLLCVGASALGAWFLLASGLITIDASRTISDNREKIVLQEGEIVADVFKKVSPSTVSIITESVNASPYSRYFESQISEGAGSGIIISKDGYVLTNRHVIPEGVDKVSVIMHDGKEYENVKVIGRDPFNDIAFLKIEGVTDLTPASFGDSHTVTPGQKVVAIGNALGQFRNSVTAGIISGIGRPIEASDGQGAAEKLENLLQTDAAINPGNSGGPLVNLKGEVVGINTAVSEQGQAIGFAIPVNDAKGMMASVLKTGRVVKPYLGVRYVTITPDLAASQKLPVKEGALVVAGDGQPAVISGSPADKAGLKEGDIMIKIDNQKITVETSLASKLAAHAPGDKIEITILRGGKEQKVTATLEEFKQ